MSVETFEALDDVNRSLLAELQEDARLSVAELGRRVGLSSPAVADRLRRLEESGVITGYHATVDPRALGLALTAVIRIRPAPREIAKVAGLVLTAGLGYLPLFLFASVSYLLAVGWIQLLLPRLRPVEGH